VNLVEWDQPEPGELRLVADDADWAQLIEDYAGLNDLPLTRCLEVARANGATSVVVETRYIDIDYRSEYSAFFARAFASHPDSARRLHFFRAPLAREQLWLLPSDAGYLGYVVIRPSPLGQIGRSMLAAPPGLDGAVMTAVDDVVTLFGQELTVRGAPFMQQDTQLGRCAHAAAWMCHYSAFRRGDTSRRPMGAFSLSADPSLGFGRPVPSEGLTVAQLLELMRVFDLPSRVYDVQHLPPSSGTVGEPVPTEPPTGLDESIVPYWDPRIIPVCCRYLNSGIPVLVGTTDHAFVLCGYRREARDGEPDWIRFVRHDDQRGPYRLVDDIFNDVGEDGRRLSPWRYLIVPLPEKLWLPAEAAETSARPVLEGLAMNALAQVPEAQHLLDLVEADELALRTYAVTANRFKQQVDGRMDPAIVEAYRFARFSRYIWVVEAVERSRRRSGHQDYVIGEVIFDATSSELMPAPLAVHVPGVAVIARTAGSAATVRSGSGPYRSGSVAP
jgi:nitroreductase